MRLTWCCTALLFLAFNAVGVESRWHWEDHFSNQEKRHLTDWINTVSDGVEALVGPLSYVQDVHFHRLNHRSGPVPWANTDKRRGRAVHFHVDLSYPHTDFYRDWTASHELSHLLFPYLGSSGRWFAEGIASYLQYQIMYAGDAISWDKAMARIEERLQRAATSRRGRDYSIVDLSRRMRQERAFVRLYWGGAAFFIKADKKLWDEKNIRLTDVITRYVNCCQQNSRRSAMDMMRLFDRLSSSTIFISTYEESVAQMGFPDTGDALQWLRAHPPAQRTSPARQAP